MLVKTVPRSETMPSGVPNCDTMRSKKTLANCSAVIDFSTGMYLAIFVYRSTTTKRLSNTLPSPFRLGGRSVTERQDSFMYLVRLEKSSSQDRLALGTRHFERLAWIDLGDTSHPTFRTPSCKIIPKPSCAASMQEEIMAKIPLYQVWWVGSRLRNLLRICTQEQKGTPIASCMNSKTSKTFSSSYLRPTSCNDTGASTYAAGE